MAKALTTRTVEQAKPGASRREVPDGLLSGLFLVVQPSGAKSWAVRYRHQGKPRKLTLGGYPLLGLADARAAAAAKLRAVATGADPAADKQAAKRAAAEEEDRDRDLVGNVVATFVERHARKRNRTWKAAAWYFGKHVLPVWGERRIGEITRRDVLELIDGIAERGTGTNANRVLAHVRKLFSWCVERDIIAISPAAGVKAPAPERSRDRVLTDDELRWFWRACEGAGYPFGPLAKVLLLTGQRRGEVAASTWREFDLAGRIWTIPAARAKNDQEHHVFLADAVVDILASLPRIAGKGYLFTTTGETPVSGWSRAKAVLDRHMLAAGREEAVERGDDPEAVEIPEWTLHDLRRTAASGMARLGFPVHVVEAVLNHRSGTIRGVAKVYNRYSYEPERRAALEAWARHVTALVADEPARNVVELAGARP